MIVVIGAGPAGLTAAYELTSKGEQPLVFEADSVVGGIARTVEVDGFRFDIGGHRFFTKVPLVEERWFDILPVEEWLVRPRSSRILYQGKYFDYPLRAGNVLRNLGLIESAWCIISYIWSFMHPPANQDNFEGWVAARFGRRLYRMFFKTYTEKVWGVPAHEIQADWAAQRIKSLSLGRAALDALRLRPRRHNTGVTSLIAEFRYPRLGPGMLWERCRELVESKGATVRTDSPVVAVHWSDGRGVQAVSTLRPGGLLERHQCTHLISSMALAELVLSLDPPAPAEVQSAAKGLRYRDFLVVALIVPPRVAFAAQWLYVHTPGVRVGRIQNFGEWSPEMVPSGATCLGMEYFVNEGDALWSADDDDLVSLATEELVRLGLLEASDSCSGHVVRMQKSYPTYDSDYAQHVDVIRHWLASHLPNLHPVGRNGMHRYNNQDHSMMTAILSVENLINDTRHDVWKVNVDSDYQEEAILDTVSSTSGGTGRDAPVLPRRVST